MPPPATLARSSGALVRQAAVAVTAAAAATTAATATTATARNACTSAHRIGLPARARSAVICRAVRRTSSSLAAPPASSPQVATAEPSAAAPSPAAFASSFDVAQRGVDAEQMNLFAAVNSALAVALQRDPRVLVFGEDIAFGGVFRCTVGLRERFGGERVFNTPLSEQGIAGFAGGLATMSYRPVAEMQFADYMLPAFDQIANEIAKARYRSGGEFPCGGLVIRAPCGAVGHGGHYHSQSPEAYFCHMPGVKVVMPRDPVTAKGLLLQSIQSDDPVIFFEPKALYRAAVARVPTGHYTLPLGRAEVMRAGTDITLIGYGAQAHVLAEAAQEMARADGVQCEVIDLMTLLPWDTPTVVRSVRKTGRALVSHEAPITGGVGAEVASAIQEECFLHLEAPVRRVCGYDIPFPLVHERAYLPSTARIVMAIRESLDY